MHGNRAIFIAQNGVDLLRMVTRNAAQRIAVIAAYAVGDVATFEVTDTDHFTTGEVACHAFNSFGSNELPRSRIAAVAPSSTTIYLQEARQISSVCGFPAGIPARGSASLRRAFHHIANHARTAARGNDGVDTGTARHVRGLQLGPHTARSKARHAVTGDGAQRIINAVNIGYQLSGLLRGSAVNSPC
jgi:hypothetical protein